MSELRQMLTIGELSRATTLTVKTLRHYHERGILEEIRRRGLTPKTPSREVYLKGPGMFFRGNPDRYLTEIQVLVE